MEELGQHRRRGGQRDRQVQESLPARVVPAVILIEQCEDRPGFDEPTGLIGHGGVRSGRPPTPLLRIRSTLDYAVKTLQEGEGPMPGKLCRTGRIRAVAVVLLLAGGLAAHAQAPAAFLVKDLDSSPPVPTSRYPLPQAALGGWVYFSAQGP